MTRARQPLGTCLRLPRRIRSSVTSVREVSDQASSRLGRTHLSSRLKCLPETHICRKGRTKPTLDALIHVRTSITLFRENKFRTRDAYHWSIFTDLRSPTCFFHRVAFSPRGFPPSVQAIERSCRFVSMFQACQSFILS